MRNILIILIFIIPFTLVGQKRTVYIVLHKVQKKIFKDVTKTDTIAILNTEEKITPKHLSKLLLNKDSYENRIGFDFEICDFPDTTEWKLNCDSFAIYNYQGKCFWRYKGKMNYSDSIKYHTVHYACDEDNLARFFNTHFTFDSQNRLILVMRQDYANLDFITYEYDKNSRLISIEDSGFFIFKYDKNSEVSRVIKKDHGTSRKNLTYIEILN
ncbi:MAG: hypothetical protein KDD24_05385 [Flavobacteriales bacterium]|nr:hypothetical protein [Flavobacteriales bacterium]MCB9173602.1 hypothetical protein [Flavobacteriales bacterium]